jgi:hypothetical protein
MAEIAATPSPNFWVFTGIQLVIGLEVLCRDPELVCRYTRYEEAVQMNDPEDDLTLAEFNLPSYFVNASDTHWARAYTYLQELPDWNATAAAALHVEPCLTIEFYNNFDSRRDTSSNNIKASPVPLPEGARAPVSCGRSISLDIPMTKGKLQYRIQVKTWPKRIY